MLDQAATQALATSIKNAFSDALPSTISDEIKAPILVTYTALSNTIAQAINDYVKQAQIEVTLSTTTLEYIYSNLMAHPVNLTVFGAAIPAGGVPPKVTLKGSDIKNMVQATAATTLPAKLIGTIK